MPRASPAPSPRASLSPAPPFPRCAQLALAALACTAYTAAASTASSSSSSSSTSSSSSSATAAGPYFVLAPSAFAPLFGADLGWMTANAPLFEASDDALTTAYAFRWRVFRSHVHDTGLADAGLRSVITEFSPDVPWAGLANTIPCAAWHHLREARWMRNASVAESYSRWWVAGLDGVKHNYYYPWATAVRARLAVEGAAALPLIATLLANASAIFLEYAAGALPQNAAFVASADCLWNEPGNEGQENSISGPGCRPLTQSMLHAEARSLSELCAAAGDAACAAQFAAEAARWRARALALWNAELGFFDTLRTQPDPPPPGPPPAMPPGFALLTNASVFCCDQSPCANGQSTFLFSGAAAAPDCAARCEADARCGFATVSPGAGPWCMNAQYCNTTNPFAGAEAWTFRLTRSGGSGGASSSGGGGGVGFGVGGGGGGAAYHAARDASPAGAGARATLPAARAARAAPSAPPAFAGVRELASLSSPWLFGAVDAANASLYASAWGAAFDVEGLLGPFGLRTAERRHPEFSCPPASCCWWRGPSWPFETSKLLSAAVDVLQAPAVAAQVPLLNRSGFWLLLGQYTAMHAAAFGPAPGAGAWRVINASGADPTAPADPSVLAAEGLLFTDAPPLRASWIAESGCADDANYTDVPEQGFKYLHSTYVDLVVTGVAGVAPAAWPSGAGGAPPAQQPSVSVAPLQPGDAALAWWCLDGVRVGGRLLTVLWDADGSRYGRGRGLQVLLDGALAASAATTQGAALVVLL